MPRIMTYNVHRCVGVDRKLDVDRVAAVIAEYEPDVVALQELDVHRARTRGVDQAYAIAELLEMTFHFNAAMRVEEELYGDAILTSRPERLVKAGALPTISGVPGLEPRGALWLAVDFGGIEVNVLNTHLGLVPREQRLQAAALTGSDWLGDERCADPTILVGDFNATSVTRPYHQFLTVLRDGQKSEGLARTVPTFPSSFPVLRIDHVFVSPRIRVTKVQTAMFPLARVASDHLPLVIDFEILAQAQAGSVSSAA
jgi:endonuclease/exonuclease/phosphatase family metal-dependent hydrolase